MTDPRTSLSQTSAADGATLELRGQRLRIEQVDQVARGCRTVAVTDDPLVRTRLDSAHRVVQRAVDEQWQVYGVTTGYGSMVEVPVPAELAGASQANLLSFLNTGAGRPIDPRHVRAAMFLRANMLLRGVSGVRIEIVDRLVKFLNADAVPCVQELGSIGASGDLVPLSAVARAITGEAGSQSVCIGTEQLDSAAALDRLGLPPLHLAPKEGLAIVNGTSFSAAIAANCVQSTRTIFALALGCHAMLHRALWGHDEPFHPFVHQCKPHPGQVWVAGTMLSLLNGDQPASATIGNDPPHLQDRYALRCLPQYLGPLVESLVRTAETIETEMNAVTDNPLIDADAERFFQSGNFLGQYVAIAMDDLRRCLGLLAKNLDVQIAQLVAPEFNQGLPASLHGNGKLSINMGLKGLQITGNSIMPLLTYYGNPLTEHFPTHAEQFNQNVNGLSWGSANLAWRSVELATHYLAVALIFGLQGVDLRAKIAQGHYDGRALLSPEVTALYEALYEQLDRRPGSAHPLIYNDADQSLADFVTRISNSVAEQGAVVTTVQGVQASLVDLRVGC